MVGKAGIAILIFLVILALIAVGISFIYLSGSYQNMIRANDKADRANEELKNSCINLRNALKNALRAFQESPSPEYIDQHNRAVNRFNNGSCPSFGFPKEAYYTG